MPLQRHLAVPAQRAFFQIVLESEMIRLQRFLSLNRLVADVPVLVLLFIAGQLAT